MGSGTLLHYGLDSCFRGRVLESAGFYVEGCVSLDALSAALLRAPDGLVLEEEATGECDEAISISRSFPAVPVILFRCAAAVAPRSADLMIPSFTAPEQWLREIEDLVEHTRVAIAQSKRIQAQSAALIQDSAAVCKSSRRLREISRRQRK